MINLLIDPMPTTMQVNGKEVDIRTSYRAWILVEQLLMDKEIDEIEKAISLLDIVFYDPISVAPFFKEILPQITQFCMACSEATTTEGDLDRKKIDSPPIKKPVLDYDYDASLIYASFLAEYGIHLTREDLHWWEFRALLLNLHSSKYAEVLGIRAQEIPSDASDWERNRLLKLKNIYDLPDKRTEEEKDEEFYNQF
ncbi:MAG: Gp15 family bacteriophage protein [Tissierellia bacterium]|nr:Gp15 family bacteriophage protein [Tissierellia bacterium]